MLIEVYYNNKRRRYNQRESYYSIKKFIKNYQVYHLNIT